MPDCTFCGAPNATAIYAEELFPDMPCCADDDACHARVLRDDETPQGEAVRLFTPAPTQIAGQTCMEPVATRCDPEDPGFDLQLAREPHPTAAELAYLRGA